MKHGESVMQTPYLMEPNHHTDSIKSLHHWIPDQITLNYPIVKHLTFINGYLLVMYEEFLDLILDGHSFDKTGWFTAVECNHANFPSIHFYFDGKYFEVSPYTYISQYAAVGGKCEVLLKPNYDGEFVLGTPFLKNYYTIWDDANSRIGLAPHTTSNATIDSSFRKPNHVWNQYQFGGVEISKNIVAIVAPYLILGTFGFFFLATVLGVIGGIVYACIEIFSVS